MARHRLHVLRHRSDLRIPNPCDEHFEDMTPEAGGRRCAACEHVVHDMSAMTARAAARFLEAHRGQRTCVHFVLRPDGSIVYRPEPPAPAAPLLAAALAACTPHGPPPALELGPEPIEIARPALPEPTVVPEQPPPTHRETTDVIPCTPPAPEQPKKPKPTTKSGQPKKPKDDRVIDGYFE